MLLVVITSPALSPQCLNHVLGRGRPGDRTGRRDVTNYSVRDTDMGTRVQNSKAVEEEWASISHGDWHTLPVALDVADSPSLEGKGSKTSLEKSCKERGPREVFFRKSGEGVHRDSRASLRHLGLRRRSLISSDL
jgi:hypothetical protein